MYIPTSMYRPWGTYKLTYFPHYSDDGQKQYHDLLYVGIPVSGRKIEDPSELVEFNRIKTGNSVIHTKWIGYPKGPYGERYAPTGTYRASETMSLTNPTMAYIKTESQQGLSKTMRLYRLGSVPQQLPNANRYTLDYQCCEAHLVDDSYARRRYCYFSITVERKKDGSIKVTDRYRYDISESKLDSIVSYFSLVIPEYEFGASRDKDYQWSHWVSQELNTLWDMYSWLESPFDLTKGRAMKYEVSTSIPSSLDSALLFDEKNLLIEGLSMKPFASYHMKAMRQAAYLDALDHVPSMNDNNISNILSLVSFIKGIVIDHRVEIPKSLQSAWLAYRYSYSTTKQDVQEAVDFMHRTVGKDLFGKGFDCYGVTTYVYNGTPVTARCRVSMYPKELDYLDRIWTGLYKYGLSPSFYVIWDSIPYSFIVDWFVPVGDILNGYDKTHMYDRTYTISDIWYSIKYSYTDVDGTYTTYARWSGDSPPEFQGYYSLENKGTTSDKVIGFRVLDLLSLSYK